MRRLRFIDDPAELPEAIDELAASEAVGLDTESNGYYAYFEITCLIQAGARDTDFVFDAVVLGRELEALSRVTDPASPLKILHGADNDVIGLDRDFGLSLGSMFDTFVAAKFLPEKGHSLDSLCQRYLGVKLEKGHRMQDFSRRPLPDRLAEYAAADSRHLVPLMELMLEDLEKAGWVDAAWQESQAVAERRHESKPFDLEGYRKVKGVRSLDSAESAVFRRLWLWREEEAQELNVPPFRVIRSSGLLELARRSPRNLTQLLACPCLRQAEAHRWQEDLLGSISEGLGDGRPPPVKRGARGDKREALSHCGGRRMERLKTWRRKAAGATGLQEGILASNDMLRAIAIARPDSREELAEVPQVRPWRVEAFGGEILRAVRG